MPEVEPLMRLVREGVSGIVLRCTAALDAGLPIARVQDYYLHRSTELLGEAEAQALLAIEGSSQAVTAITRCLDELVALSSELDGELRHAAGDDVDG